MAIVRRREAQRKTQKHRCWMETLAVCWSPPAPLNGKIHMFTHTDWNIFYSYITEAAQLTTCNEFACGASQFIKRDSHTFSCSNCGTMWVYVALNSFLLDLLSWLLKWNMFYRQSGKKHTPHKISPTEWADLLLYSNSRTFSSRSPCAEAHHKDADKRNMKVWKSLGKCERLNLFNNWKWT